MVVVKEEGKERVIGSEGADTYFVLISIRQPSALQRLHYFFHEALFELWIKVTLRLIDNRASHLSSPSALLARDRKPVCVTQRCVFVEHTLHDYIVVMLHMCSRPPPLSPGAGMLQAMRLCRKLYKTAPATKTKNHLARPRPRKESMSFIYEIRHQRRNSKRQCNVAK